MFDKCCPRIKFKFLIFKINNFKLCCLVLILFIVVRCQVHLDLPESFNYQSINIV